MKPSALLNSAFLAALATSLPVEAQIYQYQDAAGRTVISDRPPAAGAGKTRTLASEATTGNGAVAERELADRELAFRKRRQDQQQAADKAQQEAADRAARREDCAQARRQLQMLESGTRMTTRDDQGERAYLDDSQRATETGRARKAVTELCR